MIHKSSGRPCCRWLCKDCGKSRGIYPTPKFLMNLREMDEGGETEVGLKVLAQV
ncbi:hypothetical protein AM1_F0022 (plasmid) [Acaryochloris marina MBIC11017]|uniref:Uncharacterized protein n=1 Tax=Acaryochloris marina (strain MBIC 11017) TaxID=329726 RepID=A8ZQ05_ACAM1|nr:hypothetical protein AM1_F0022 [Acaryochloris marina MBIC11017]